MRGLGLSPRVRGNLRAGVRRNLSLRSIPARAGEPDLPDPYLDAEKVYPRACGGTFDIRQVIAHHPGLSPRVRGNPRRRSNRLTNGKSQGLSPRVRGNQVRGNDCACLDGKRVYPRACGGTLLDGHTSVGVASDTVYPRACGGTHVSASFDEKTKGLSPKVRGNQFNSLGSCSPAMTVRSIPARAGEPVISARLTPLAVKRVYPRACGGTIWHTTVPRSSA